MCVYPGCRPDSLDSLWTYTLSGKILLYVVEVFELSVFRGNRWRLSSPTASHLHAQTLNTRRSYIMSPHRPDLNIALHRISQPQLITHHCTPPLQHMLTRKPPACA